MRRAALGMAILAALLCGAPSAVLAAPPNRLEAAGADPTDGTTQTPFRLSVRYVSDAGDPASAVIARVGPLEAPLQLSSGTVTDGTWTGTTLLPAGTWPLTFYATTESGPSPSLAGPALSVAEAAASPTPDGRPGSEEPAPTSTSEADVNGPEDDPVKTPETAPQPSRKPRPDSRTPGHAPHGRNGRGPSASDTPQPAPQSPGHGSRDGRRRGDTAPGHRSPSGTPGGEDAPLGEDTSDTPRTDLLLVLAGIVSISTIALLGTGWMLASRERQDRAADEGAAGIGAMPPEGRRTPRARRGAGVHPAHDPVLAALGLDDPEDGSHAPVRGAARGAAPRPRKSPRAPR